MFIHFCKVSGPTPPCESCQSLVGQLCRNVRYWCSNYCQAGASIYFNQLEVVRALQKNCTSLEDLEEQRVHEDLQDQADSTTDGWEVQSVLAEVLHVQA